MCVEEAEDYNFLLCLLIFKKLSKVSQSVSRMAHYKGAASEGNRAANLIKKREKAKEEMEKMKQKISEVNRHVLITNLLLISSTVVTCTPHTCICFHTSHNTTQTPHTHTGSFCQVSSHWQQILQHLRCSWRGAEVYHYRACHLGGDEGEERQSSQGKREADSSCTTWEKVSHLIVAIFINLHAFIAQMILS